MQSRHFWTVFLSAGALILVGVAVAAALKLYETRTEWMLFVGLLLVTLIGVAAFQAFSDRTQPPRLYVTAVPVAVALAFILPKLAGGGLSVPFVLAIGATTIALMVTAWLGLGRSTREL